VSYPVHSPFGDPDAARVRTGAAEQIRGRVESRNGYDERVSTAVAYFSCASDYEAGVMRTRTGGPLGWRSAVGERGLGFGRRPLVEELGPACDGFRADGYPHPVAEAFALRLVGIDRSTLDGDPRWGLFGIGGGGARDLPIVTALTATLRDTLGAAADAELREHAGPWALEEGLPDPALDVLPELVGFVDPHLEFLRRLARLARDARARTHRLYCYYSDPPVDAG
jgi:hypothetical protein